MRLRLPLATELDATPEPEPEEEPLTRHDLSLTILLVDDDPLVLMGTIAMLEDIGHNPVPAGSASEALEILHSRTDIEMVITDHAMPEMTGLELAQKIHGEQPELPVILATGYAELPHGATTELPRLGKPFLQGQLARVIENVAA